MTPDQLADEIEKYLNDQTRGYDPTLLLRAAAALRRSPEQGMVMEKLGEVLRRSGMGNAEVANIRSELTHLLAASEQTKGE